ncbi:MAG: YbjN domain-containing protein [Roseitalea sp.]|nr:YbjN domain-containing protein [Roseitalea sp.]MBO6723269.1 YbjN domain-containing protein [Roseitalea sp.]MBO6744443.1 YbjN domain-containing protein [Roseitalea sp.]
MNRFALCLLAGLFLPVTTASAQKLVDATDPEAIINLLRGFGSAVLEEDDAGDPMIVARIDGTRFLVLFYGCEDGANCKSIQFRAAWESAGNITMGQLGGWNADKRFGKAYLDDVKDPVVEMDVNLFGGVSTRNLEDTIDWWQLVLADFKLNVLDE